MIKLILGILIFTTLGLTIQQSDTFVSVDFAGYHIYASLFTWIATLLAFIFCIKILLFPFRFFSFFNKKYQHHQEIKRRSFIEVVLQALINQNVENFERLSKEAKKLFKEDDPLYWEIQALLFPTKENYQNLTRFSQTIMGGIRGLFRYADSEGDYEKMHQLIAGLSPKQLKTPWALQALFQMAVQENDWDDALNNLKNLKPILSKLEYNFRRACLLFLTGKTKEAYYLDENQPAIAIAWAKENPKKAIKILRPVWNNFQNWEIYLTLKKMNEALPAKQQQKQIKELIADTKHSPLSLLAMADIYLTTQAPLNAKEELDEYLKSHTLTHQVAQMMAKVERDAWHHEEQAKEWEEKGNNLQTENAWTCTSCGYKSAEWHGCCPACHTFNSLR